MWRPVCLILWVCWVAALSGCRWTSVGQNTMGVQMFQQGRFAEALQQFEAAKQADPTNPDTYYNLASTYHKLGVTSKDPKYLQQAEALYNQCLDMAPNHVDCHRALAVMLVESGRQASAFDLLKNWASRNPTLADARVELSRLYQEFNQPKVAEQYLDEALAMDPNNAKAWAAKGRMRELTGDLQQAVQNYQQSLAINGLQPDIYQRVAALKIRMASNTMAGANTPSGTTVASQGNNTTASQPPAGPKRY